MSDSLNDRPHFQRRVLTLSASKYLTGHPIQEVIDQDWKKADDSTRTQFDNVGFDVDPRDRSATIDELRQTLRASDWDGILLGWCLRGYAERTELFEELVDVCVDEKKRSTKLLFCTGPDNLFEATVRSFPV